MVTERTVLVRLKASPNDFNRGLAEAALAVRGLRNEINTTNERTAWLAQGFLALGPALVPLGAAATPILSGLVTQMTLGAAAAGVLALGLNGIGDGLKAVDAYQLEPTVANLEKMRLAIEAIGPDGAQFVMFLDSIEPKLRQLQMTAKAGMLPGFEEGITSLLTQLPAFRAIVGQIASALGQLGAEAGKGLSGEGFKDFFTFLQTDARPILVEMGRTFGNFVEGFAAMIVAFAPMSRDFSTGFLNMSRDFASWAHGLEDNESFQSFVEYVQESVPRALDFLGSLGSAFGEIVQAAAPVGDVILPVLARFFDIIALFASTPIGSIFIAAAAAMAIYGRAVALASLTTAGLGKAVLGLARAYGIQTTSLLAVTSAQQRATLSASALLAKQQASAAATRSAILRTGALIGGLALLSTGAAQSVGLQNTAMLGTLGLIGGGWGVAIGAGIGLVMDFSKAGDSANEAMSDLNETLAQNKYNLGASNEALVQTRDHFKELQDTAMDPSVWEAVKEGFSPDFWDAAFTAIKDGTPIYGEQTAAIYEQLNAQANLRESMRVIGIELGAFQGIGLGLGEDATPGQLTDILLRSKPALDALKISLEDLEGMSFHELENVGQQIAVFNAAAESATGKSAAVGAALQGLERNILPVADAANLLKSALDNLFGVQISQVEAVDNWYASLKALREALKETNGEIFGQSDALRDVRSKINDSVEAMNARAVADARVTGSGREFATTLLQGRDAIISQAKAAGASKQDIARYLNELKLTPKFIATQIMTPGLLTANERMKALGVLYKLTPKQVNTVISQAGHAKSMADINALLKRYGLTPSQLMTILRASDKASPVVKHVNDLKTPDKKFTVKADPGNSFSVLDGLAAGLRAIQSKTITITTRRFTATVPSGPGSAAGDFFPAVNRYAGGGMDTPQRHEPEFAGPGPTRVWREPETQGESYIPHADDWRRPRAKSILEQTAGLMGGDVRWFAEGGMLGGITTHARAGGLGPAADDAARALRGVRREADESGKSIREETKARREAIAAKRNDLRSTVTSAFRSDIFATDDSNPWSDESSADPMATLRGDIRDARKFKLAVSKLKKKGLDGAAFDDLVRRGDLGLAQQYASQSRSKLNQFEQAYNIRQRVTAGVGSSVAGDVWGEAIRNEVKGLRNEVQGLRADVKGSAKATGDAVGNKINVAARAGTRNRTR